MTTSFSRESARGCSASLNFITRSMCTYKVIIFPPSCCSVRSGHDAGVVIMGAATKGRLEGCDIAGNKAPGIQISEGADPFISLCM